MACSMPGFPVLHHLPEFAQTHIHWIGDVIQPSSHLSPLSSPVSIFPSIRVFSNELALHIRGQTPKARKVEPHSLQTKSTNTRGTPPWDQMSSGSWIGRRMPGISSVEGHFPRSRNITMLPERLKYKEKFTQNEVTEEYVSEGGTRQNPRRTK